MREDSLSLEWVTKVAEKVSETEFEHWSILMWMLWKERNTQCFNGDKLAEELKMWCQELLHCLMNTDNNRVSSILGSNAIMDATGRDRLLEK
ncbi:unnamed protein product [Linum trigynum]|uniref:Uncharacterized protein n=1 Tax=Linum trigynum TaxID=586398 RepID=A0AAV2F5L4_9ROSI